MNRRSSCQMQRSWNTKIKLLYGLSGNLCAFPKCMTKMIQQNNVITSAIAHIEGKKKGSARYNPNMTDEQRDDIKNLILLCPTHHTFVDQDPTTYTVKYLKQMKFEHEKSVKDEEQYYIPENVLKIVSVSINTDEYSIERIHNLLKLYKTIEGSETKKLWHQHFLYVLKGLKISSTLSVDEKEALNIIFKEIFDLKSDNENMFQDFLLDFLDKIPYEIRNDYIPKTKPYIESILYKDFENINLPRLYVYLNRSDMETVTYLMERSSLSNSS